MIRKIFGIISFLTWLIFVIAMVEAIVRAQPTGQPFQSSLSTGIVSFFLLVFILVSMANTIPMLFDNGNFSFAWIALVAVALIFLATATLDFSYQGTSSHLYDPLILKKEAILVTLAFGIDVIDMVLTAALNTAPKE